MLVRRRARAADSQVNYNEHNSKRYDDRYTGDVR